MGLQLNSISDEDVSKTISKSLKFVEETYPSFDEQKKKTKLNYLGKFYYQLATSYYQQEAPLEKIKQYFELAAEVISEEYLIYELAENDSRSLWKYFIVNLPLVVCFGTSEMSKKMAGLEKWRYYQSSGKELNTLHELTQLLKNYITTGATDIQQLKDIHEKLFTKGGFAKEDIISYTEAFIGLITEDENIFNEGINAYAERYKRLSKKGTYRYLSEGLMCLPLLLLCKFAKKKEIAIRLDSPYVPLFLLQS